MNESTPDGETQRKALSVDELRALLASHEAWKESDGRRGERAVLDGLDLRKADLVDAELSEVSARGADLRGAELTRASLRGADLRDADLGRAALYRADLRGADLRRANLERAELRHADLRHAILRRARLARCDLQHAEMIAANLSDAEGLNEAKLQNADLTEATGLLGSEFARVDLTGTRLPDDIAGFSALDQVSNLSQHARNVFLAMLAACVFSWLTIATTTDAALIGNAATTPLPIIQTQVPIAGFYWAAPLILLVLYGYLHIYLQRLWEALASLPAIFPDGRTLDQRAYPWLLSGLVQAYVPLLRPRRPALSKLQVALSVLAAWVLVPMTLAMFWWRYLPRHEAWGTLILVATLLVSIVAGIGFYRRARATLIGRDLATALHDPMLEPVALFATVLVTLCFSIAATSGSGVLLGLDLNAELREAEISQRPLSWTGRDATLEEELAQVSGAAVRGANLRNARAGRAFLARADLREADLRGADLSYAALAGTLLVGARFGDTGLTGADLRRADLSHSELADQDLAGASLSNADFRVADLSGADLGRARGVGALFTSAALSGAELGNARFPDSDFRFADLSGADLLSADLSGADLTGADLSRANLHDTDLSGTNLDGAKLDSARFFCGITRRGFDCTDLTGANLVVARGLTRGQLDDACGDETTKLPPGFSGYRFQPCKRER